MIIKLLKLLPNNTLNFKQICESKHNHDVPTIYHNSSLNGGRGYINVECVKYPNFFVYRSIILGLVLPVKSNLYHSARMIFGNR